MFEQGSSQKFDGTLSLLLTYPAYHHAHSDLLVSRVSELRGKTDNDVFATYVAISQLTFLPRR